MKAMQKFSDGLGAVNSVADVFEPAEKWSQALKPAKERVSIRIPAGEHAVGHGTGRGMRCHTVRRFDKKSEEKYFATAFRGKKGDSQSKVMSLLWAQEGGYWKIIAIRIEDGSDAGLVPNNAAAAGRARGGRTAQHRR